jgi:hypothetical protein
MLSAAAAPWQTASSSQHPTYALACRLLQVERSRGSIGRKSIVSGGQQLGVHLFTVYKLLCELPPRTHTLCTAASTARHPSLSFVPLTAEGAHRWWPSAVQAALPSLCKTGSTPLPEKGCRQQAGRVKWCDAHTKRRRRRGAGQQATGR